MGLAPVTGPSAAASHLALAQVLQHGKRSRPFEARCVAQAGGWPGWGQRFLSLPGARAVVRMVARWRFADTLDHVLARREAFVRAAEQFVASWGAKAQVVTLGCGFDGSGVRLAARTGCAVAMWDLEPTLAVAQRAASGDVEAGLEVAWCAADLERDGAWATAWVPGRPTLFVAEGVLMYLQRESVRRLLRTIAGRHQGPWALFGTWLEESALADPRRGAGRVARHLRGGSEEFRWASHPESLAEHLAGDGWIVTVEPERWPAGIAPGDGVDAVEFPGWSTAYGEKALLATRV